MPEEPEQVLPQQRVAALGRIEEVRADQPVDDRACVLASITAGIAKMIMNAVTSIAQTNSGMRLSDMPGARSLKIVVMMLTAAASAEISVKVIICAQMSTRLPGEYSGPASGT